LHVHFSYSVDTHLPDSSEGRYTTTPTEALHELEYALPLTCKGKTHAYHGLNQWTIRGLARVRNMYDLQEE
jgi:hypothetical protein